MSSRVKKERNNDTHIFDATAAASGPKLGQEGVSIQIIAVASELSTLTSALKRVAHSVRSK